MIERSRENQALHENAENVFNKLLLRIKEKNIYIIYFAAWRKSISIINFLQELCIYE